MTGPAGRLRGAITQILSRMGFKEDSFLLVLAIIVGVVTAAAAVGFHEVITLVRNELYLRTGEGHLYHGRGMLLLMAFPAAGGLLVGIISQYIFRVREGHGIVDVMESVVRTSGFQSPMAAIEKILTSGVTIGSGGSAGAEGPIVQIGAGIASGIGQLFRVARSQMPVLIGCGSAAGISAIFNAPFGGVLFTLEVIMQDFSIKTFTPVVVASVIAQVSELMLFKLIHHAEEFHPIFAISPDAVRTHEVLQWGQVGNFVLLGLLCGLVGLSMTRLMYASENVFDRIRIPRVFKPALGGAILGAMGVLYIVVFGWLVLGVTKPVPFSAYPMPAFFGDSYGFIEQLLSPKYYTWHEVNAARIVILLACLCGIKVVATCVTLGSGGSGGVIAPSLFLGATIGAVMGSVFQRTGWFPSIHPEMYALVGMGAALAAVVHAPLASILICFEVTEDYKVMVPAMLACVVATAVARVLFQDSIYTLGLRRRGIRMGGPADRAILMQLRAEQVTLEPASIIHGSDPFQKILELTAATGATNFVVVDENGEYRGMVVSGDIQTALLEREAIPLLVVSEMTRRDLPLVKNTDDLGTVLEAFAHHEVSHLPVTMDSRPNHVIGLISRAGLMRKYQQALAEAG
ncbi:MAG TPA: chloride channel protein [Tepidisphaeraceae bacterium]|nr:chloride channel protein [Tepidisphaeraceae bacterium]